MALFKMLSAGPESLSFSHEWTHCTAGMEKKNPGVYGSSNETVCGEEIYILKETFRKHHLLMLLRKASQ